MKSFIQNISILILIFFGFGRSSFVYSQTAIEGAWRMDEVYLDSIAIHDSVLLNVVYIFAEENIFLFHEGNTTNVMAKWELDIEGSKVLIFNYPADEEEDENQLIVEYDLIYLDEEILIISTQHLEPTHDQLFTMEYRFIKDENFDLDELP